MRYVQKNLFFSPATFLSDEGLMTRELCDCRTGFTPVSSIPQLCLSKYFVWFSSYIIISFNMQERILLVQLFCTSIRTEPSKILAFPFRTSYLFVFSKLLQNLRKLHVMVWCCMDRSGAVA